MGRAAGEKRRRRELTAAAAPRSRRPRAAIIAVVAVIAVVVVAVVVTLTRTSSDTSRAAAAYPVTADGTVVVAGRPGAPVTVDVYEDYLCPICERFEQRYGSEMTQALNDGKITVHYHQIAILDSRTNPPGYSTRAANAALCSVPAGIFPAYHEALFAQQPAEGSAGLGNDQLVAIGSQLGAQGDFASCVTSGRNASAVTAETQAAVSNPALQSNGVFGTPTVAIGGTKINISDPDWLKNAISAGGR
jgi:protein-disulfide isomerase